MNIFNEIPELIPKGTMTPFAQTMFEDVKHKNPIIAYRQYYKKYKNIFVFGLIPYWYSKYFFFIIFFFICFTY